MLSRCADDCNNVLLEFADVLASVLPASKAEAVQTAVSAFRGKIDGGSAVVKQLPTELAVVLLLPLLKSDPETGAVLAESISDPALNKFLAQVGPFLGADPSTPIDIWAIWISLPSELHEVALRFLTLYKNALLVYVAVKQKAAAPATNNMMELIQQNVNKLFNSVKPSDLANLKGMDELMAHPVVKDTLSKLTATAPGGGGDDDGKMVMPDFSQILKTVDFSQVSSLLQSPAISQMMTSFAPMLESMMGGGGAGATAGSDPNSATADPMIALMGQSSSIVSGLQTLKQAMTPSRAPPAPLAIVDESAAVDSATPDPFCTPVAAPDPYCSHVRD